MAQDVVSLATFAEDSFNHVTVWLGDSRPCDCGGRRDPKAYPCPWCAGTAWVTRAGTSAPRP